MSTPSGKSSGLFLARFNLSRKRCVRLMLQHATIPERLAIKGLKLVPSYSSSHWSLLLTIKQLTKREKKIFTLRSFEFV